MRRLFGLASKRAQQNLAGRNRALQVALLLPASAVLFILGAVLVFIVAIFAVLATQDASGCGTTVPVGAPQSAVQTAAEFVRYFESQGISANGSAGITGNLEQENGFSPVTNAGGVGIAQWDPTSRGPAMQAWDRSHGLDPGTVAGQVTYIVYDLRTNYATLLVSLNSATSPAQASDEFEVIYERCGTCERAQREQYAVAALQAAGGNSVPVSLAGGGACVAIGGAGGDPIPGFTPGRDDMGVDACGKTGMPIYAPAASTLVGTIDNWYTADGRNQPLLLFQFTPSIAGTYRGDQFWYVAEQIIPVSMTHGTQFGAGAPVAYYANIGSCIEIGWGSPTTNSRTLVPTDANPPRGALTLEAEAFKVYFHIPWVGQSP